MERNILLLLIVSVAIFICMKFINFFIWQVFGQNGTLVLTGSVILILISIPFIIGLVIGVFLTKFCSLARTDEEIKVLGGGVVGCSFLTGICFGGTCLPAAVLGSVLSIVYVIPILLGIKCSSYFNI